MKLPTILQLIAITLLNVSSASAQPRGDRESSTRIFVNPIAEGADPWVVRDPNKDRYLWCMSEGNRAIAIHTSETLTALGKKHVVWEAPAEGACSREVWAPELHFLDNRWHIYFAASDGRNENHLAYVLRSEASNPLGPYQLLGPFRTGQGPNRDAPNIWAIDMTVLEHRGKRFAIWSGWDAPGTDRQCLYIAAMKSPTELSGPRVRLCSNADYLWERTQPKAGARGLHEAPQVLQQGAATYLFYSCGASWLPTYKLGLLELVGDNPLRPSDWKKREQPVFQSTETTYGVGHSCFVPSPDGEQLWHVFHAKRDPKPGWRRAVFVQPIAGRMGSNMLRSPVAAGEPLSAPSGEPTPSPTLEMDQANYYGHHQFATIHHDTARLGRKPENPINTYRCGEKLVWRRDAAQNFTAQVAINFHEDEEARDAGILFRCSRPAIGYDAQQGYFGGLIPRTNLVILGKTDGKRWIELARAKTNISTKERQRLAVSMDGDNITVSHNGKVMIRFQDGAYSRGALGLRVVDTDATFTDFEVTSP